MIETADWFQVVFCMKGVCGRGQEREDVRVLIFLLRLVGWRAGCQEIDTIRDG